MSRFARRGRTGDPHLCSGSFPSDLQEELIGGRESDGPYDPTPFTYISIYLYTQTTVFTRPDVPTHTFRSGEDGRSLIICQVLGFYGLPLDHTVQAFPVVWWIRGFTISVLVFPQNSSPKELESC